MGSSVFFYIRIIKIIIIIIIKFPAICFIFQIIFQISDESEAIRQEKVRFTDGSIKVQAKILAKLET